MIVNPEGREVKVLVPFDMVFDVDLGVLMLINFEYHNEEYFNFFMFNLREEDIEEVMTSRISRNPLCIIDKGVLDQSNLDQLYGQFLTDKYDDVLRLTKTTPIFDMVNMGRMMGDTTTTYTVICRDQREVDLYIERGGDSSLVILKDENFHLNEYTHIFVNDIYDLLEYDQKELINRVLYIADCRYNKICIKDMDDDEEEITDDDLILNPYVTAQIADKCLIHTVSMYPIHQEEVIEEEDEEDV